MALFPAAWPESRIVLLDGGLSTTLEEEGADLNHSTWSSHLLGSDPDRIRAAHREFVEAGSDVVETATYQASERGFMTDGHSGERARELMRSAIPLAGSGLIALSLGSYGATITPSAEYSGLFDGEYALESPDSISALARWHSDRLRVFAEDETWDRVAFVAFETIPLLTEVKAIRRAMRGLDKPFTIASAWPDGVMPHAIRDPQANASLAAFAATCLDGQDSVPFAIGLNCTKLRYIETLAPELVSRLGSTWLTIAPDGGGLVYDVHSRTWQEDSVEQGVEDWAQRLAKVAIKASEATGVVVGGCCKSRPDHIRALARAIGRS